jgi:hypothetical protein
VLVCVTYNVATVLCKHYFGRMAKVNTLLVHVRTRARVFVSSSLVI